MSPRHEANRLAFAAALALIGAGCGSAAETGSTSASLPSPTTALSTTVMATVVSTTTTATTTPTTTTTTTGSETTVADNGSIDRSLQTLIDIATADLTARLGVDRSAVTVLTAKAMTWPDKSIGCPKPGVQYLQVLVDGALIELQAGGKTYSYHSGDDGKPELCEQTFSGQAIPPETTA